MSVHIATSPDIAKGVARVVRSPVPSVPENLMLGPSALDAAAHIEARCAFWAFDARERARFRRAYDALRSAVEEGAQVTVWTSPLWQDRLMLWALGAWRARRGGAPVSVVMLSAASSHAADIGAGSLRITAADVRAGVLAEAHADVLLRRWEQITASTPVLAGLTVDAEMVEMGRFQAEFLPRRHGAGLALSRVDGLLFACLGEAEKTPVEVLVTRSSAGDELRRVSEYIGDVFIARRLSEWSHRGALDATPHRPERLMNEARYRISTTGWSLVGDGLDNVTQAPPLSIWGTRAYDPAALWVVTTGPGGAEDMVVRLGGE
jgi:hypothetical protein